MDMSKMTRRFDLVILVIVGFREMSRCYNTERFLFQILDTLIVGFTIPLNQCWAGF